MSTKPKIFNLALSALLLARQVSDTETDIVSNEVRVLNQFYDDALTSTLQELDLDRLSESIPLELVEELEDGPWRYAYKYPTRCAFLRRIVSCAITDTRDTFVAKAVKLHNGQLAIFTNEYAAIAECIPKDVSLAALNVPAVHAVANYLAFLSAPLLTGKGAKNLRESIFQTYQLMLSNAQELDKLENFSYDPVSTRSEFVATRIS